MTKHRFPLFPQLARLALAFLLTTPALAAAEETAPSLQVLEQFMQTAQRATANFTQTVTMPARQGQTAREKKSSGNFAFERPGHFRFEYDRPLPQIIVADGQTLWLYDVDLEQVTKQDQQQALGSTPAAILTTRADMEELRRNFTLTPAPDSDGQQWVEAVPKNGEAQLRKVRVGFRQGQLATLEIEDNFGQTSVMQFTDMRINPEIPAGLFSFTPPAGANVIEQPATGTP